MKPQISFFVLAILLMSIAYAAETTPSISLTRPAPAYGDLSTNMRFTETEGISQGGSDIGGTSICPGDATIAPNLVAVWATSTFSANTPYPQCKTPTDPACLNPESFSGINLNQNVKWISAADYAAVTNPSVYTSALFDPSEDKNGVFTAFSEQKVNYERVLGGAIDFPNSKGNVNIFCKGIVTTKLVSPGGATTTLGTDDSPSSIDSVSASLTSEGSYTISSELSGVQCMGAVEKVPVQAGSDYFAIYLYRGNTLSLPTLTESRTVTVADKTASTMLAGVSCPLSAKPCPPPPGPFPINPSEQKYMVVTIRNDGDVALKVDSVLATNGFKVEPLNMLLCTALGITCPASNGFGVSIAPGTTRDLHIVVTAPTPDLTGGGIGGIGAPGGKGGGTTFPTTTRITFTASTLEATCSGAVGQKVNLNLDYTIGPGSGGSNPFACTITPSSATMPENSSQSFALGCTNNGTATACSGTAWSVSSLSATLSNSTVNSTIVTMLSNSGTGLLTATNGSYTCSASLTATNATGNGTCASPPCDVGGGSKKGPEVNGCLISPLYSYVRPGQLQTFTLRCKEPNYDQTCSGVTWDPIIGPATSKSKDSVTQTVQANSAPADLGKAARICASGTSDGKKVNCCSILTITSALCSDYT